MNDGAISHVDFTFSTAAEESIKKHSEEPQSDKMFVHIIKKRALRCFIPT